MINIKCKMQSKRVPAAEVSIKAMIHRMTSMSKVSPVHVGGHFGAGTSPLLKQNSLKGEYNVDGSSKEWFSLNMLKRKTRVKVDVSEIDKSPPPRQRNSSTEDTARDVTSFVRHRAASSGNRGTAVKVNVSPSPVA